MSSLYAPSVGNSIIVNDSYPYLNFNGGVNYLRVLDTTLLHTRASYEGNIHSTFFPYSLVDKSYVDSVVAASAGTISKGFTIEFPSASENVGMWKTPVAITVSSLEAVLVGSATPSVTFNIAFGTDRTSGTNVFTSGQTATSTTTGHTFNSGFNDATIPAGSFIWITTSAQSGTVTNIELTINYTED